jgi:hypothetical protein
MPLLNEWTRVDEAGMRALREVKIGIIDEKVIFTKVTIHVRNLEKASRYSVKYPVYESIENWIEEIKIRLPKSMQTLSQSADREWCLMNTEKAFVHQTI